ncbi:MAG: cytochrome C [candidate division Zixibacteria bacterium]|nr:cytochrome C [candidate division Zixibacteria bacterium]
MKIRRLPRLAYNVTSTIGTTIASIMLILIIILFITHSLVDIPNPYIGIFLYMVLPPVLVFGLLLIPIGMFREWRRLKRGGEAAYPKWPYIDFGKSSHRNAAIIFSIGTGIFVTLSSIGTYQAYHFTESVEFCGTTCHDVMHPEYIAYQKSPHARVPCAACHVGSGAGWYTKSKLSGMYQVYAVLADEYPKPIPTPIQSLRPAQETCEQCHWPERFYGAQQRQFNHYMYDENNTSWPINMLIKTGGGNPKTGQTAGIHWHMNINMQIEYIARDESRQVIPWVKITDRLTGRTTTYQNSDDPLSAEEIDSGTLRVMDCMDCHNRPSHIFNSPDYAIDLAILTGKIDPEIPDIKRIAVEVISENYESTSLGLLEIANTITEYYRNEYPELYKQKRVQIDDAILATKEAFSNNIFPEMKVLWSEYPENIGHFTDIGCMRCHSGNHESEEGLRISTDCNTCHIILSQGSGDRAEVSTSQEGLEFHHPEDIDLAWQEMGCHECHTGVQP